ncbi:hypothetical protein FPY71_08965 [Aureimonas fodinaquatilis]|uniref:Uncharacterized protein n=1 Tax=Aureimonas fodinaquatilis TaxID=2565783 RepID=A0A5B0DUX8_9HYPH|nr:hypothetical protein [Aureimonas fodinaquatilis]KAA0970617.1 hypothetical protein FPY71_08965 [Aureimonas fodinaquatilis]
MHTSGPIPDSETRPQHALETLVSPEVRSRILEVISSARMVGKAELLANLAPVKDPTLREEFERQLEAARENLERMLVNP